MSSFELKSGDSDMIERFNVEIMSYTTPAPGRCQLKHTDCSTRWQMALLLIER